MKSDNTSPWIEALLEVKGTTARNSLGMTENYTTTASGLGKRILKLSN
jgi:hypothetical protein